MLSIVRGVRQKNYLPGLLPGTVNGVPRLRIVTGKIKSPITKKSAATTRCGDVHQDVQRVQCMSEERSATGSAGRTDGGMTNTATAVDG